MAELIDPAELWRADDHGDCCGCCFGYCMRDDQPAEWMHPLYRMTSNGITYVGSKFLMLRTEVVAPLPDDVLIHDVPPPAISDWTPPSEMPKPSTERNGALLMSLIDTAGLVMCMSDHPVRRPLYRNSEFAGWSTANNEPNAEHCISPADLPTVRTIASRAGLSIHAAAVAFNIANGGEDG